jgi:hypothetical protein
MPPRFRKPFAASLSDYVMRAADGWRRTAGGYGRWMIEFVHLPDCRQADIKMLKAEFNDIYGKCIGLL